MAAGSIIVDLLMRTGSFETDTARAAKTAEKRAREIEASFKKAGTVIGAAIGAGVTTAAVAFDQLVKQAGNFKDLEEITGSTAEDIASLSVAAATAGVGVEDLAGQMNRLTKSLSSVDDESKGAGAALKNLGIPLEEFKKLDPVAQIDALTKAFANFKDGPEKSATAIALFGKQGAELLKVFKALEEQGGRQKILSQQQIELADAYSDAQARSVAQLKLYSIAAATEALPAVNDLVTAFKDLVGEVVGIDKETGKLASNGAVKEFAESAADALAFIVDAGRAVAQVFQAIGTSAGAAAAVLVAIAQGEVKQAIQIAKEGRAEIDRILSAESFRDRLARARANSAANPIGPQQDNRPQLPTTNLGGAPKTPRVKSDTNDADKLLKNLQDQYVATIELTNVEKALIAIRSDGFKGLTPEYERLILEQAAILDQDKELTKQFKASQEQLDEAAESARRFTEAGLEIFEATRTPVEKLNAELSQLNTLLEKGAIDLETFNRAQGKAFANYDATFKPAEKQLDEFTRRAASNIQDQIGSSLYDALTGNFKDIEKSFANLFIRIAAEATAAQIGKALFGDFGKTGDIGGFFGDIGKFITGTTGGTASSSGGGTSGGGFGGFLSSIGSLFSGFFAEGGYIPPGQWGIAGERGPEPVFGGRTGMTVQPYKPAGQTLNVYVQAAPNMSRDTALQQGAQIGLGLQRAGRNR